MNEPFKFKQFTINQDRTAMKIGTDSVLLGAWTSVENNPESILDIGAGTGVLALMLAQRSSAELVDAIEIDDDAYKQCVENFEASPWSDRLFCYHASLQEFTDEIDETYDLIICNPPFFETPLNLDNETLEQARAMARFTDSLSNETLLASVSSLMNNGGMFSVVIPFSYKNEFVALAERFKLYPKGILNVRGNPETELKRSLIEFTRQEIPTKTAELIIETERHKFTQDYINLTNDFYLKM